ncbi:peptidyl-prolyl cis-trans isomerase-cyclophilin family protein [Pavlovales sp. CCMP2436]|nr:peptidyl-prolyl cis-trans isomerase-cyclophilin family protein [Pavlovales sp. CCMP2436]
MFKVEFVLQLDEATQVPLTLECHPEWAPKGAARFRELVESGYYNGCRFHRVVPNFMAQVGICGDPVLYSQWASKRIDDDAAKTSNARGTVTFATSGPNARTCQVFFNLVDNSFLDDQGFSPFARVLADGMEVVDKIYGGYGEGAPKGRGPEQGRIKAEGDAYLASLPKLSYIASAKVVA